MSSPSTGEAVAVGDGGLLVPVSGPAEARALAAAVVGAQWPGVLDAVGGLRSVLLVVTPGEADPEELARAVEASFAAALPDRPEALRHFVATPACGLAMRSVLEAERIFDQLRAARSALLR